MKPTIAAKRIVHLMRDSGDKLAQRRHFFGVHQLSLKAGRVSDVGHNNDDTIDMALLVPHGTQAYRKVACGAIPAKKRYLQIVDRSSLKGPVKCLRQNPAPSQRHHIHKRMTQKIGLHGNPIQNSAGSHNSPGQPYRGP